MKILLLLIFSLSACASPEVTYKRKQWQSRWADDDRDCQNTRAEILIERSLGKVTFSGKKECVISSGKWKDYYYPGLLENAKEIDIDHLVPLYEAHKSGGAGWSKLKKKQFANDPENLVITSRTTNRKKGAHTLKSWLPVHFNYACRYYKQWMHIKNKYQLNISNDEINALDVSKCSEEMDKNL